MTDNIDDLFERKYIHPAREKELINTIIEKNSKAAKQELANNYMWLTLQIADKYKHPKINLEKRTLEAAIGLFKAVHEVTKKPKTMTFKDWAVSYMERAIRWAIEDYDAIINIPVHELEKFNKMTHKMKKVLSDEELRCFQDKELKRLGEKYNKKISRQD